MIAIRWCAAWIVWLVGAGGLAFAGSLMPLAIDVSEPDLVVAQVLIFGTAAVPFWLWGTALLLSLARRRRWVIALSALPWAVLAVWSVPTLLNVCGRPGGMCG